VWCDDVRDIVVTLPNRWGPLSTDYVVSIDVFDLDGSHRATIEQCVPANGLRVVHLGDALLRGGVERSFRGHAEVRVAPKGALDEWPANVDILVGFEDHGRLVGEVQVGSDFFNCGSDEGLPEPSIRRTRVSGRVAAEPGHESWLYLALPIASKPGAVNDGVGSIGAADAQLVLLDSDGCERATANVVLSPHGALCTAVRDIWPELDELLAPTAIGTIRVRSIDARLYGYSWIEERGSLTVPICHLIGG
jgi:hypothetical protein